MTARNIELPLAHRWLAHAMWVGMDFLFVLSGFLIGSLLFARLGDAKGQDLKRFFTRRAFRIFPLYYVCLVLISFLPQPTMGQIRHQGLRWQEWVYLTNYPFDTRYVMYWSWSLSVEEHFYTLAPFLVLGLFRLKNHKARLGILAGLWTACLLAKLATIKAHWGELNVIFFMTKIWAPTHIRFDTLLAGMIGAYCHQAWPGKLQKLFQRKGANLMVLATLGVTLALVMSQFSTLFVTAYGQWYWAMGSMLVGTVTSPVFTVVILWGVYGSGRLRHWLSHRVFLYLASLSYGTYLLHVPVVEQVVIPYLVRPAILWGWSWTFIWVAGFCLCATLSTLLAYLLHLMIEKPMLQFRNRVAP